MPLKVAYKKLRARESDPPINVREADSSQLWISDASLSGTVLPKISGQLVSSPCLKICCIVLKLIVLDIYVPPAQVLDTVNLYTSEDHKRKLSLRFLSWFLLKKDIQTASHDSIEDARYALLLYKLWKDFKRDDRLGDVMDDIFFEGHKLVRVSVWTEGRHR